MKENTDTEATVNAFETMMTKGQIPQNLDVSSLEHLEKLIQQISEVQRSQKKGQTNEEILSILANNDVTNVDEIKKGLAFYKFLIDNKDSISQTILKSKKKLTKFRQSGHLVDQTLKYNAKNKQLSLFDVLKVETKEKISQSPVEVKTEGIRLSPTEDKILKSLSKLIYEKQSSHLNAGNHVIDSSNPPVLRILPAELYKAYLDRDDYSGDDIKFINKSLLELSSKKFLIIYHRKRTENGKKVTDRIEDFQNLIKIQSYLEGLSESELTKLELGDKKIREKKNELIISLNPIFIDQINTKYIEYPSDINKRTTIAAGGHNFLTESAVILRDYLLREISAKRYSAEINEENLLFLLRLDGYLKSRKKKIVADRIAFAIDTGKNLGIILHFEKVIGSDGQQKYIFTLNENFE